MSRTTAPNRGRHVAIKATVITALVVAGSLGVYLLIRVVVALHTP